MLGYFYDLVSRFFNNLKQCYDLNFEIGCWLEHEIYLIEAAKFNRVKSIEYFLRVGYDIESRGKFHETALHTAAFHGQLEAAKCLVEANASIYSQDYLGNTPLHRAVYRANTDVVKYLVDNKADINAKNDGEGTPLQLALSLGYLEARGEWKKTFEVLIDNIETIDLISLQLLLKHAKESEKYSDLLQFVLTHKLAEDVENSELLSSEQKEQIQIIYNNYRKKAAKPDCNQNKDIDDENHDLKMTHSNGEEQSDNVQITGDTLDNFYSTE